MMTLRSFLFLGCLLVGAAVHAQELKVGAVSEVRILRDSAAAKTANAKLERDFSVKEREVANAEAAFEAAASKFEREAPTLSDAQRQVRQRQLGEQERDVQRRKRDFQEELTARRNDELALILERANMAIKQFAEKEKYDLIFQEAAYISPRLDITDRIIKLMDTLK